jgi:ribonuclease HI
MPGVQLVNEILRILDESATRSSVSLAAQRGGQRTETQHGCSVQPYQRAVTPRRSAVARTGRRPAGSWLPCAPEYRALICLSSSRCVDSPRRRPRRRPGTVPAVPDATTPTLFEPPSGREPVVVYTDGACSGNPAPAGGPGWWRPTASAVRRAVSADDDESADGAHRRARGAAGTVAGDGRGSPDRGGVRLDLGRQQLPRPRWQANGLRNARKQPVANADLWKPLVDLVQRDHVTIRWVKGHGVDPLNDLVDGLAVAAIPS